MEWRNALKNYENLILLFHLGSSMVSLEPEPNCEKHFYVSTVTALGPKNWLNFTTNILPGTKSQVLHM